MQDQQGTPLKPGSEQNALLLASLEILLGLALSTVSFYVFLTITEKVLATSGTLDTSIAQFVYSIRTPTLTVVMKIVTSFGDEVILAIATLVFIKLNWKERRREAIVFAAMLVMALVVNIVVKEVVHRPRPAIDPLFEMQTYSFPSGHAMNAIVFYTLIARYIFKWFKSDLAFLLAYCSILMVFFVGFSRVYLGVHYLSDVLAGFVGGFFIVVTAILLERTLAFYRLYRSRGK